MRGILEGRVAVITGSGMGIGRAIALDMARQGAAVITNNRMPRDSGGDAASTANEIKALGCKAVAFFGDISEFDMAREMVGSAVHHFGRIDILVNNAGGEDKRGNRRSFRHQSGEQDRRLACLEGSRFSRCHRCSQKHEPRIREQRRQVAQHAFDQCLQPVHP